MSRENPFFAKYILTAALSLLMLTLFDSNAWWKVLLYSLPAAALNQRLASALRKIRAGNKAAAASQGAASAIFAYFIGLTPFFRTTFGTLLGFAVLLTVGEYLLQRLNTSIK